MSIEKVMFLDYETYSSVDIKNGVYAYTESPDFEVLLVSFRAPGRELLQFSPREDGTDCKAARLFFEALSDESLILKARNAQFERVCTGAYFKRVIHPDRWRCTAVLCAAAGLPRSLDESGRALGLAEERRHLAGGELAQGLAGVRRVELVPVGLEPRAEPRGMVADELVDPGMPGHLCLGFRRLLRFAAYVAEFTVIT